MSRYKLAARSWPWLVAFALSGGTAGACVTVAGDRILAGDLAKANSYFAALDPSVEIGFSPRPGASRVLRFGELKALARRHGMEPGLPDPGAGAGDACFVRLAGAGASAAVEIRRGETVEVDVHSGAAHLRFQARAESEGRAGQSVLVRNPSNGHVFPGLVEARGKVVVRK